MDIKERIAKRIRNPVEEVEDGAALFDVLFGDGWEHNFEREKLRGVQYDYVNGCSRCAADIASGLPETVGWRVAKSYIKEQFKTVPAFYGLTCHSDQNPVYVAAWNACIEKRLAALRAHPVSLPPAKPQSVELALSLAK